MELHFQLESLSIFKRKIKFPFENKQDQLNLCEEERSHTPGHRSQGWGKRASQVSSLGPLNYWPRTGTLRGRTGRACPLSQPPGTSAHSPLWSLAWTTSHLSFILSAEAWSRMALQPMPCSLPEKLPFTLPQERHPALPWAGEKRKGFPSCLPILPTEAPLLGVVTLLWVPLLILCSLRLMAPEDGTGGYGARGRP